MHRVQLDGLRAVAVAAVAWSHWERPYQFGVPFGAGVHLFYVLSGFLITGIPPLRESIGWHVAYLSNAFTFVRGQWPGAISHFWSLAVEEQFYLIWPWLMVFAPRTFIVPGVLGAIAIGPAFRWWLAANGYRESMLGLLTPACLDSLGVGALLAVLGPTVRTGALFATAIPFAGIQAAQAFGVSLPPVVVAIKGTLQACAFGWLVGRSATGFAGTAGRILSSPPVVYIGRISYGVYLAHGFAGAMAATLFTLAGYAWPLAEPWRFIVLCAVTIGAAALSWHFVEAPVNRLKTSFPYKRVSQPAEPAPGRFAQPQAQE